MALRRLFTQDVMLFSHLPTGMLIIGTGVFWFELLVMRLPGGHTSWLAWGLWLILGLILLIRQFPTRIDFRIPKLVYGLGILASVYLGIVFLASLLPPHLAQEYDAINYHITIPRQHLITHDLTPISWSVADLFLLPLDYALSPFWLVTALPNKFPQFFFLLGVLALVFSIVFHLTQRDLKKAAIATIAVMALHMTAIQSATAMLDMVMLYCVLAGIHSLLSGRYTLAAIEWAFFFWSKSFIPPMVVMMILIMYGIIFVCRRFGFSFDDVYAKVWNAWKRLGIVFLLTSLVIAGPFLLRSMYYAGSPIYGIKVFKPIAVHTFEHWHWMNQRIVDHLNIIDGYGHGRSFMAWIKHFWLIAVPEKGVNNAFDYPVGLVYLLVFGPFVVTIYKAVRSKKIPVVSLFIVVWWALWWMGSQQTRFLLIPMCLMIMVAVMGMKHLSRIFIVLIIAAMLLEIVSLVNAHRPDWGKSGFSVLRDKDKALIYMAQGVDLNSPQVLDYPDVAFASFPVIVRNNKDNIFVFPQ